MTFVKEISEVIWKCHHFCKNGWGSLMGLKEVGIMLWWVLHCGFERGLSSSRLVPPFVGLCPKKVPTLSLVFYFLSSSLYSLHIAVQSCPNLSTLHLFPIFMYKLSLSSKLFDYLLFVGAQPQLLSLSMSFIFCWSSSSSCKIIGT